MNNGPTQADLNRAKIRKFALSIFWQIAVFTMVVYATIQGNEIAGWMMTGFGVVLGIACFSYFILAATPAKRIAQRDMTKLKETLTPTLAVQRYIALVFTIAEVAILFTHGWLFFALFWAITEVLQWLSVYNIGKAVQIQDENGDWMDDLENQAAQSVKDEEFTSEIMDALRKHETELSDIDGQLRALMNGDHLPPEGSENHRIMKKLNEKRNAIVDAIEDQITKAGLAAFKRLDDE